MKMNALMRKHVVIISTIAVYFLCFAIASGYMEVTGDNLTWASLLFLCPALLGLAAGTWLAIIKKPEKYRSLRPRLLILLCILTSVVCICQSVINFTSGLR